MRYISLFVHKIRLQMKSNPLLLAIFCLGGLICTLSVVILYGNVMPHMTNQIPEKYYRSFDVVLSEPISLQDTNVANTVYTMYGEYGIENVIVTSDLKSEEGVIRASLKDSIFEDFSSDAKFIEDTDSYIKQIILSRVAVHFKQSETFELFGNTYLVVGYASDTYLTYDEFWNLDLSVTQFRVVLVNKPTAQQREALTQQLLRQFPGCSVQNAKYYIEQDQELTFSAIGIMIVLYLLLFLSLAFILYDIIQSELYVHLIFRLHGATSKHILRLIVGEQLFLLTLFGALACLVHYVFYDVWFSSFNLYAGISYGFVDYAVITLMTDLVALCCMLPFLHKITTKYSYQIKKEAMVF